MRIEARDGLLDSSGGEVEQRELAHPTERAPHAGAAPSRLPPRPATSGKTRALTARGHGTFCSSAEHGNIQQAASRARLRGLQVVTAGNDFLEKERGSGVSKELMEPVAFQQPGFPS